MGQWLFTTDCHQNVGARYTVQGTRQKTIHGQNACRAPCAAHPAPACLFEELRFLLVDKLYPVLQVTL
jgi:hypothetical protein